TERRKAAHCSPDAAQQGLADRRVGALRAPTRGRSPRRWAAAADGRGAALPQMATWRADPRRWPRGGAVRADGPAGTESPQLVEMGAKPPYPRRAGSRTRRALPRTGGERLDRLNRQLHRYGSRAALSAALEP